MGYYDDLPDPNLNPAAFGREIIKRQQAPFLTGDEAQTQAAEERAQNEAMQRKIAADAQAKREAVLASNRADVGLPPAPTATAPPAAPTAAPSVSPATSFMNDKVLPSMAAADKVYQEGAAATARLKAAIPPPPGRARAIRMPDGKILLTNQDSPTMGYGESPEPSFASRGGKTIQGRDLYNAAKFRLAAATEARDGGSGGMTLNGQPMEPIPNDLPIEDVAAFTRAKRSADWRTGTNMEGPATKSLGFAPEADDGGFSAAQVKGTPGGGSFSGGGDELGRGSIADNPDTHLRLALEDVQRKQAIADAEAALEESRAKARQAQLSPEDKARQAALQKAPQILIGQYIEGIQKRNRDVLARLDQRMATPGDPAYVDPTNRAKARASKAAELDNELKDLIAGIKGTRQTEIPGVN